MDPKVLAALTSSKNEHWCTPWPVQEGLAKLGPILLDPCSNPQSTVNARAKWYGPNAIMNGIDGLAHSWQCNGLVYVNPPYGRKLPKWVKKATDEALITKHDSGINNTEIVFLCPARVDTKWFQELILPTADAVCLWKGRLRFDGAPAPAPFPSALIYWGHRPVAFKFAYLGRGWML